MGLGKGALLWLSGIPLPDYSAPRVVLALTGRCTPARRQRVWLRPEPFVLSSQRGLSEKLILVTGPSHARFSPGG